MSGRATENAQFGLNGAQVDAEDLRLGVLVRELNRPDARTSTYIKNTTNRLVLAGGTEVEFVVEECQHDVVRKICRGGAKSLVLLLLQKTSSG